MDLSLETLDLNKMKPDTVELDKDQIFQQKIQMMTNYHQTNQHEKCWEIGLEILSNHRDLFHLTFLEKFSELVEEFLMALSVSCFYLRKIPEGLVACDRFYCLKSNSRRNNIFNNLKFYQEKLHLTSLYELKEGIDYNDPDLEKILLFSPTNLSLVEINPGVFLANLRLVNYRITKGGYLIDPYFGSMVVTHNRTLLIKINKENQIQVSHDRPVKFWPDYQISPHYAGRYEGYEDLRLIKTPNNRVKFLGTTLDTHPGKISISMGNYYTEINSNKTDVEEIIPLQCSNMKQVEKNWLPFYHQGHLHCVYSIDPLIIFRIYSNGQTKIVHQQDISPIYLFRDHRGGAIVPYNGGYLLLCHFTSTEPLWRKYYRRFIWFDDTFRVRRISRPWVFTNELIEYSLGMSTISNSSKMIFSYSFEDRKVFLGLVEQSQIDQMLIKLENF